MARAGDIIKILAQVLEALRGGKKLAAREKEKLHGNALLSLSAFGGEPKPDVLEEKVLLPLRPRYRCSATEEAEVLRWLVDDMPESNPWKTVLGAVRDFKVLDDVESGRDVSDDKKASEEDLEASCEISAEDEGPVVNEPEDVSSVASSHKNKSGKKKKVLLALMQALGVSDDDDSGEEDDGKDEPRSEIKPRRPRKVLVKLKEGERVLDFWSSFCVTDA
jgi:hypothetical protein